MITVTILGIIGFGLFAALIWYAVTPTTASHTASEPVVEDLPSQTSPIPPVHIRTAPEPRPEAVVISHSPKLMDPGWGEQVPPSNTGSYISRLRAEYDHNDKGEVVPPPKPIEMDFWEVRRWAEIHDLDFSKWSDLPLLNHQRATFNEARGKIGLPPLGPIVKRVP